MAKACNVLMLAVFFIAVGMVGCGSDPDVGTTDTNAPAEYKQHGMPQETKDQIKNRPEGYPAPQR